MSKYEQSIEYGNNEIILKGEKLLIEEKPKKNIFMLNKILAMAPFAILWLCFDGGIIYALIKSGAFKELNGVGTILPIVGFTLFFALHLMPVWIWLGNILTANRKWKNTKYIVTDKRIIIQNGFIAENYQTMYYKDIKDVTLHVGIFDKLFGVGDVLITNKDQGNVSFLDIENYRDVYQRLQKIVLDIQTDIEYPNDLRPKTNHGYNTEYVENEEE